MLKRIAHNSALHTTLPSLPVGNRDLKPLQDLISLEKNVVVSAQRLSLDITKAAEALRIWGLGEGEDLGDTLDASCSLLTLFANALSQYCHHENTIRENMKAVRTREEVLDEMKQRRKNVVAKAEASEKKLNKMSPEHKNLQIQTETLNQLRDQIRQMDTDIMVEEAAISDFKRESTRNWMFLKFGGLQEFTEKGTIAAEYGKLIISNIPQDKTQPGFSRTMYQRHGETQSLLQEATMAVNDISLSAGPGSDHRPSTLSHANAREDNILVSSQIPDSSLGWPPPDGAPPPANDAHFMEPSDSNPSTFGPPRTSQNDPNSPFPGAPVPGRHSADDFGIQDSAPGSHGPGGGRFATFPVKGHGGPRGMGPRDELPSLSARSDDPGDPDDSFSSSVAAALRASGEFNRYDPPSGPPPGAAPAMPPGNSLSPDNQAFPSSDPPDGDGGLAYMSEPHEMYHEGDKRVRFDPDPSRDSTNIPSPTHGGEQMINPHERSTTDTSPSLSTPKRIPPPTFDVEEGARTKDAEVAEEIRKEMDALGPFNPPISNPSQPPDMPATASEHLTGPSDLAPPSAPFAHRNISPRPSVDMGRRGYDAENAMAPDHRQSPPSSPGHYPGTSISSMERPELGTTLSAGSDVSRYGTPSEYPRNMYANKSNTSLSSMPPIGSSTGKISAAAFRRPQNRLGSSDIRGGETSPLSVKKKLPTSPYPEHRGISRDHSPAGLGMETGHNVPSSPYPPSPSRGAKEGEEDFDYIGAYVHETDDIPPPTTSPPYADYGRLGKVVITNGPPAPSPSTSGFTETNVNDQGHLR